MIERSRSAILSRKEAIAYGSSSHLSCSAYTYGMDIAL